MAKFTVAVGDKVAYSVQFLRSIGMSHGEMARARGEVIEVKTHGSSFTLATIKWNCEMPERVNVANLTKVGPNMRYANCD